MPSADPRDRLIVALDYPDRESALRLVEGLSGLCRCYKIGLELFAACGPRIVESVRAAGAEVFLDLKLHDIPETVGRALGVCAALGAALATVHADGGPAMLARAARAARQAGGGRLRVLGVTVLTSLDLSDLHEVGVQAESVEEAVVRRARLCQRAGLHGVVASPGEVVALRAALGGGLWVVTPGVRAAASLSPCDDQKRVASASRAIADGADQIVVGRPVRDARDPRAACQRLLDEIAWAQERRPP